MATVLKQLEQAASVTLLSTELNSLANNAGVVSSVGGTSGVFNNAVGTTNMDGNPRGKLEFLMGGTVTALTAGGAIQVWFLLSVDGTNFENGTPPPRNPDVVIPLGALTTAQRVTRRCSVPVGKFKVYAVNAATGQAMPSSGNTLTLLLNTDEGV